MAEHRIFSTAFADVYVLYVQKVQRKQRTQEELDAVIFWLTGYDKASLDLKIAERADFRSFFDQAPVPNPERMKIRGVICGVRIEEIEDPLMREIRYLDKLVDELAKGRPMEKILNRV